MSFFEVITGAMWACSEMAPKYDCCNLTFYLLFSLCHVHVHPVRSRVHPTCEARWLTGWCHTRPLEDLDLHFLSKETWFHCPQSLVKAHMGICLVFQCGHVTWSVGLPKFFIKLYTGKCQEGSVGEEAELPTGEPPSPFSAEETYGDWLVQCHKWHD